MSVYILPGNIIIKKSIETIGLTRIKKKTIYDIALKDEREMKRLCSFGFHKKDSSPHVYKIKCEW